MYKVLEMDQLGADVWDKSRNSVEYNPDSERNDKTAKKKIDIEFYTKHTIPAVIPALYAFLKYDGKITPSERDTLNYLYLDIGKERRVKFFIREKLNRALTPEELAVAEQKAKECLLNKLVEMGSEENLPLILYAFENTHKKNKNFAKALIEFGFNIDTRDFTCTEKSIYNKDGFGIFLLSNNQLEMIIPRNDEIKAYLSECTLYATTNYKLYQEAIQVPKGSRDFKGTVRSDLYGMKVSWNKWIMQAY